MHHLCSIFRVKEVNKETQGQQDIRDLRLDIRDLRYSMSHRKCEETVKTILLEQDPPYHEKDCGHFLSSPTSKDGVLVAWPPFHQGLKLRKIFKHPWIVSLALQASCQRNINGSFQILRPIRFVHVFHQIGVVLHTPPPPHPITKHGGSS